MATTKQQTYSVGGVTMDRPFKLRRLGHFGFNVFKMDEGIHFYRDLLGFKMSDIINFAANPERAKLMKEKGIDDARGRFFHYGTDHHAFVLFPKGALDTMRGGETEVTINQITWQVGSLAEVVNAVDYFTKQDVHINRSGRDMPGSNWHTYISDPDNHTNELYYGMEQIGWLGRSKPLDMYYRKFNEVPELPQMSEEAEVEEAKAKGIDVMDGFIDIDDQPAKYDVGGVLLARPFKITKIGPVNIFVDNVAASVDFYTKNMGFILTEETEYMGETFAFLRIAAEHHTLGLWPKSLRDKLNMSGHTTNAAFGIEVGSYDQLRNGVAFLKENGVEVRDVPEELRPGVDYAVHAIDPDGHAVMLYYYMEQLGWQGIPRPHDQRRKMGDWPETLAPLSDTYMDQVYQGPLG